MNKTTVRPVFWLIGGAGIFVRVALSLVSSGSNDIVLWEQFSRRIDQLGLGRMYEIQWFNHPPLMGLLGKCVLFLSQSSGIPFPILFKGPAIAADTLTACLLWKIWSARDASSSMRVQIGYAASLIAILISAYHGNTDSMCVFFCLLSAYFREKKSHGWAGAALAAAINVKLIPVLLIPVFALPLRTRRDFFTFAAGLAIGLIPFLPFLVFHGDDFVRHVIAYNSQKNPWGVMMFLRSTVFTVYGRYVLLALMVLLGAWARRKNAWNSYELGALCFSFFLMVTPGFGIQYLVYVCPFLFAVSFAWGMAYSWSAGVFAAMVYFHFWTGEIPFYSHFTGVFPGPAARVGVIAWLLTVLFAATTLRKRAEL